ncbi:hypothetical protein [Prescottella sp. R16]|uniref:hypothetical protein n=1 Tax=Prescottella sp. R16 TaxID=3064529 RepID=UPI00272EDB81|nr:hypothetical protein [Prescottella sp. R16]
MKLRSLAVRAIGAAAVTTAAVTGIAGTASAAPAPAPILYLSLNGPTMPTLGQNDFCTGIIDTAVETDPTRPGVATIALTPRGMHGVGPGWEQNRTCRVQVSIVSSQGLFGREAREVEILAGEQPGPTVRTEIYPGPGVQALTVAASWVNPWFQLRPQMSVPSQGYYLVP